MRRLLLLLAASALATTPAVAQHSGHDPHAGHTMPPKKAPAKKPPAKEPAAKKPAAKKAAPKKPAAKKAAAKKSTVRKSSPKPAASKKPARPAADPHSEHRTPPPTDPHAGHEMRVEPQQSAADSHAGHQPPAGEQSTAGSHADHELPATPIDVPIGPPPPEALQGPENAAETAWGRDAMAPSQAVLFREHGGLPAHKVLVDQLETRLRDGRAGYFLNMEGWYGGDIDKLWLKAEAEGSFGRRPEQAEFQALWSHAIDPWFDLQAGVRLDAEPRRRAHLVLGIEGLAPYWIEVDAAAFLSDKGDVTLRAEAEHDVRVTQELILQPRAEVDFALQDVRSAGVGSGLSSGELGLRLRYQLVPNFAPYVGLAYERAFGATRRFRRAEGDDPSSLNFVVGLRTWF